MIRNWMVLSFFLALALGVVPARAHCGKEKGTSSKSECPMMKEGKSCAHCDAANSGACDGDHKGCCGGDCEAKEGYHHKHGHDWSEWGESAGFYIDHAKSLELTDAQVTQLKKISDDQKAKETKLSEKMNSLGEDLSRLVKDPKPNRRKISGVSEDLGEVKGEWMATGLIANLDAKAVLTEVQKTKLAEMYAKAEADTEKVEKNEPKKEKKNEEKKGTKK